jgi:hypothetical protein
VQQHAPDCPSKRPRAEGQGQELLEDRRRQLFFNQHSLRIPWESNVATEHPSFHMFIYVFMEGGKIMEANGGFANAKGKATFF